MLMLTCYIVNRDVTYIRSCTCNVGWTGRMETVMWLCDVCDELLNVRPSPKMYTKLYVLSIITMKLNSCV